jgi:GNAT superfamily N-acetyltransferase
MPRLEDRQIGAMNEQRQAQAIRDLADESVPIGGGFATFSPGVPWINHATCVGFGVDVGEAELDRMEAFYGERGVTPKIELTTFATESFLGALARRGYTTENFENVLARPLDPAEDPFGAMTHPRDPAVEIRRTDPADAGACRAHAVVVTREFCAGEVPEEHIAMAERALRHPRSVGFTAWVGGELVAGSGMEIFASGGERICSLWGTGVREPYRRRGIQQSLIARRLAWAVEQGCSAAIIESKPGVATERNAAHMGFALAYVRVCMAKGPPA